MEELKIGQTRITLRSIGMNVAMLRREVFRGDIVKAGDFFLYKKDNGEIFDVMIFGIIHIDPITMEETTLDLMRNSQEQMNLEIKELEWKTMKPLATVPQNEQV